MILHEIVAAKLSLYLQVCSTFIRFSSMLHFYKCFWSSLLYTDVCMYLCMYFHNIHRIINTYIADTKTKLKHIQSINIYSWKHIDVSVTVWVYSLYCIYKKYTKKKKFVIKSLPFRFLQDKPPFNDKVVSVTLAVWKY